MKKRANKTRKTTPQKYTPKLSPERYAKYLTALLEGQQSAIGKKVYWDVGPGERTPRVLADFQYVARKESIEVVIAIHENGLVFVYPDPDIIETTGVRIRRPDGKLKATVEEMK